MTSTAPARPVSAARPPDPPPAPDPPPRPTWRSRLFRWEAASAPYVYVAPFFLLFAADRKSVV